MLPKPQYKKRLLNVKEHTNDRRMLTNETINLIKNYSCENCFDTVG